MSVLNEQVLVLNKNWLPVNVTTVEEAIKQMVVDAVTAMNIVSDEEFYPVKWAEWIDLPVRDGDKVVRSQKLTIRAPTVVLACRFSDVPLSTLKFTPRNVKALYKSICQYSGEYAPDGNVDHKIPLSKGGENTWENVVWCKREINSKKGNRLNTEVGLPNVKSRIPTPTRIPLKVMNNMKPDWRYFVAK